MVIGDQRGDAERARPRHAFDARDAVVDRDEQIRFPLSSEIDQLGREPVAELEAIRHQVVDVGAEDAQRAHADRARRGAVGIVVGDDQKALPRRDRIGEQRRGWSMPFNVGGSRPAGPIGQLGARADAAPGVDPGEQRVDAGVEKSPAIVLPVGALDDLQA